MKGYTTLHISIDPEIKRLFDRMTDKTASRSQAETLRHALRALEVQEAQRDKEIARS